MVADSPKPEDLHGRRERCKCQLQVLLENQGQFSTLGSNLAFAFLSLDQRECKLSNSNVCAAACWTRTRSPLSQHDALHTLQKAW